MENEHNDLGKNLKFEPYFAVDVTSAIINIIYYNFRALDWIIH